MGLEKTGRIARILIDPRNPDVVLAAAIGTGYGPQPERGVFRTADGGKTWEKVLFVDENTGVSDIAMDPNNPRTVFAGAWPIEIKTWGRKSGGPGGGLFVSRDGGVTWKRITGHGLPDPPLGKIALAMLRSELPARLCADRDRRPGLPLALGRRGRELEARQPQPALERAAPLLHPHARHAGQRQRGLLSRRTAWA